MAPTTTDFQSMSHTPPFAHHDYNAWTPQRLGEYLAGRGLQGYTPLLVQHKITGRLAPLLKDDDLKDIGINIVGDRLTFKDALHDLSRVQRYEKRLQILWEGEAQLFYNDAHKAYATVCGCNPIDPPMYKLSVNHLKVSRLQPTRIGPIPLWCFGAVYTSNHIDLSKVDDVDVHGIPAPCCMRVCCLATGRDVVEVESRFEKGGKVRLLLPSGHGDTVSALILNQVEESQKMERS